MTDAEDCATDPSPLQTSRDRGGGNGRSTSGPSVRLEQLTIGVLEPYLVGLEDPEIGRLTGSRATFRREVVEQWLLTRADQTDRVDWAVHRRTDNEFLGEAVLNDIDLDNRSASFRVWLLPAHWGHGYGTELATLVLAHAFGALDLHRVELSVFSFNPRAQRAYEKAGFTVEGRRRDAALGRRLARRPDHGRTQPSVRVATRTALADVPKPTECGAAYCSCEPVADCPTGPGSGWESLSDQGCGVARQLV